MKTVVWQSLSEEQQSAVLERPAISDGANITAIVSEVLTQVQQEGDAALQALTAKFDKVQPDSIRVSQDAIEQAASRLSDEMKQALEQAYKIFLLSIKRNKHNRLVWKLNRVWCVS